MTEKAAYNSRGFPLNGVLQTKSGCQSVGNGIKDLFTEQGVGLYSI